MKPILKIGEILTTFTEVSIDDLILCDGKELKVDDYPLLFKTIDYNYGGRNDVFKLPDLRGDDAYRYIQITEADKQGKE